MSTNQSGESSEERMEREQALASTKEADEDEAPVSMSFIRRILDSETTGASETALDTSGLDFGKASKGVSFSGVSSTGSVASSTADDDKDREELAIKVQSLKLDLKQAKLDRSAEKAMNRKKDRNLVKLAKELNRRGDDIRAKNKVISELNDTVATLEAKLAANKTELEARVATNEKQTREHTLKVSQLADEQRKLWKEHQAKISEIQDNNIKASQEHVDQTDRMRKEILASNRTIESLRAELERLGSKKEADELVSRGMTAPLTLSDIPLKKLKITNQMYAGALLVLAIAFGYKQDLLSVNAMCAPLKPGMVLDHDVESDAPWWAPYSVKSASFVICGARPRTRLSWTFGKQGNNVLSVVNLGSEAKDTLLQTKAASAVVNSGSIATTDKKGVSVDSKAPWAF